MKIESLQKILKKGIIKGVKSIFFFPDLPPLGSKKGLESLDSGILTSKDIDDILYMTLSEEQRQVLKTQKEIDYSFETTFNVRVRIAAFHKMNQICLVARPIPTEIPPFESLGLPSVIKDFTELKRGIVFITGPTGSGKSTTLASLIDIINENKSAHIITVEDPIEFIFRSKRSIISQREIGRDTKSYRDALKSILREDPDVILIGEIRDMESMEAAMELAETGHLVFTTLHTINVVQTINRIIDFFPDHEKQQVRKQISQVLQGIVCQRLLPRKTGDGFVCACEVLKMNHGVSNLIKEDRVQQIYSMMDTMRSQGVISMDNAVLKLYRNGIIELKELMNHITDKKKIAPFLKEAEIKKSKEYIYGKDIIDVDKKTVIYQADYTSKNISYFDASGTIVETENGLLFRDTGQSKGEFHFIGDYTILNGKKNPFPLKNFFNLSYLIREVKARKPIYRLQLKIVENMKSQIDLPKNPYEMVFDNVLHSIAIPIPKIYEGRYVRYYIIFFDKDIDVIEFSNIYFS